VDATSINGELDGKRHRFGWLTTGEVAGMLRRTERSVRGYLSSGQLVGERVGKDWLVDPVEVARFDTDRKPRRHRLSDVSTDSRRDAAGGSPLAEVSARSEISVRQFPDQVDLNDGLTFAELDRVVRATEDERLRSRVGELERENQRLRNMIRSLTVTVNVATGVSLDGE
jgi:hypothetical protein